RVGRPQDKGAPRRSNVQAIASPYSVVDELTAYAVRLALYADSIRARARGSGKGIAAQDRLPALVGRQAQRQKLSWLGRWHASAVRIGEVDRDHGFAFRFDVRDVQRAEPSPGRRRAHRGEAGVTGRVEPCSLAEYCLERHFPAGRQGRDQQGARDLIVRVPRKI